MKRAVVVLCVVLMLALSSFAYGQWEGQSPCTTWLYPGFKTTFYAGALVDPSNGLALTVSFHNPSIGAEYDTTYNLPFRGVWLGLSADLALTNCIGVMASAGWLIPSSQTRGSYIIDGPGGGITDANQLSGQFSVVDGAVFLNTWASTKLLAGFRWDHLDTQLTLGLPGVPVFSLRDDFTVNAYLPYLGVQVDQGGVVVRIIGFPVVPGDIKYALTQGFQGTPASSLQSISYHFTSGQFLEVFASYSKKLSRGLEIGGFLTFDYLHGGTDFRTPADVNFNPGYVVSTTLNLRYWTMGGSLSWDFNL